MSTYDWLLFLHVTGAFLFVGGVFVAAAFNIAAQFRERPSEIALLLGLTRFAVVVMGVGSVMTLVFGLWLVSEAPWGYGYGQAWVIAAIVLWVVGNAMGGQGGNREKATRIEAERLAEEGRRAQRRAPGAYARSAHAPPQLRRRRPAAGGHRPDDLEARGMTTASLCGPACGGQLFLHVLGAFLLFGSVLTVAILAYAALRVAPERAQLLRRVGFWTTLGVMRPRLDRPVRGRLLGPRPRGARRRDGLGAAAGARIADAGAVLVLLLLAGGWFSIRRPKLGPWVAGIAAVYLVALAVAWFFMSAKPDF